VPVCHPLCEKLPPNIQPNPPHLNLKPFPFAFSVCVPNISFLQGSINDGAEFKAVADAMKVIGFKQEEIQTVYKIVAAILHLVKFSACSCEAAFQNLGRGIKLPTVTDVILCPQVQLSSEQGFFPLGQALLLPLTVEVCGCAGFQCGGRLFRLE